MISAEWFENWFDSPYYHLLYSHRDENEAELFIRNLINKTGINKEEKVWDNACGRGRHAKILKELGLQVIATDLSDNNIKFASENYAKGILLRNTICVFLIRINISAQCLIYSQV